MAVPDSPSRRALLGAAGFATLACGRSAAQSSPGRYPERPVKVLVGFAAGGGVDIMARIAAQGFSEALGQQFVVENRPGASGNIAASQVARADPDGYALLVTADVHLITPLLSKDVPFDPVRDFTAIGTLASGPQCIAAHPRFPAANLAQLVEMAKAGPGQLSYASGGSGTLTHMAMELFCSRAGIKLLHVPYKGSGPSIVPVIAGEIPLLSISLGTALPQAKAGKLRILAVTSAQRTTLAPEIPTVAEAAGLQNFTASSWMGVLAPSGTPSQIVTSLNGEIEKMLHRVNVLEQLAANAWTPFAQSPSAFAGMLARDLEKWGALVRETGIKME